MEANASVDMFSKVLENQLLQTTKLVEEHLDSEIQKLDQLDEDELERLKEKRLEALKKAQQQKQEWLSKGHGEYREIPSERDFFQEVKESKKVVCHFYRDSTFRCKILDRHLVILSKKHLETKFLKLNVEKAPFLCERLRIKVIPTLALVKDGKTQDFVVGFSDLGNTDDFTTETLEWRLGCSDILNYSLKWFWKIPAETTEQLKQWIHGTEQSGKEPRPIKVVCLDKNRDLANPSERNIYSFGKL